MTKAEQMKLRMQQERDNAKISNQRADGTIPMDNYQPANVIQMENVKQQREEIKQPIGKENVQRHALPPKPARQSKEPAGESIFGLVGGQDEQPQPIAKQYSHQ